MKLQHDEKKEILWMDDRRNECVNECVNECLNECVNERITTFFHTWQD